MLFTDDEIQNFTFFKDVVINLVKIFDKFEDKYNYNSENSFIYLETIKLEYEDFLSDLKYSLNFLENLFIRRFGIDRGGSVADKIRSEISELNFNLVNINMLDLQSIPTKEFTVTLFSTLYNYFKRVEGQKFPYGRMYGDDKISPRFSKFCSDLESIVASFESKNTNISERLNFLELKYTESQKYFERIVLLEENIKNLKEESNENTSFITKTVDNFILTREKEFDNQVNGFIDGLKVSLSTINNKYENEIKEKVEELSVLVKQTDQDFKSTYKDYDLLKKMVQARGEQEVTNHYENKANWERFTYWFMTTLTFIIIGGAICLATLSLNDYKAKTSINIDEWSQKLKNQPIEKIEKIYELQQKNALIYLILRLVISIFLFSSIIYTSRIAYRAYIHMRHSENMMLKLATLRPFINQLEEEDKNQIHKDLVPDYFGKDAGLVDTTNEKFKDLPANVSAVAMKAIEQISGSGSNSSTEKNNKKPESETG